MKKSLQRLKGIGNPVTWLMTFAYVFLTTQTAFGQNANPFDTGKLLPADKKDQSLFDSMGWIFAWGLRIMVIAGMLFGVGTIIFNLFSAFQAARDRDEWGSFVKALVWSVIIIIVSAIFAALAWSWADNVEKMGS